MSRKPNDKADATGVQPGEQVGSRWGENWTVDEIQAIFDIANTSGFPNRARLIKMKETGKWPWPGRNIRSVQDRILKILSESHGYQDVEAEY